MLNWCSYCQQFQGEIPPYDNLIITHGLCKLCAPKVDEFAESDFLRAESLRRIQARLFEVGRRSDLKAAGAIIEEAGKANVREVDILFGIIAPTLYRIGEDWKRGILTVKDEHRFTRFFEKVVELIAVKVRAANTVETTCADQPEALLVNAPGNKHTLAVRMLELWLMNKGMRVLAAAVPPTPDELVAMVDKTRPDLVLISMALAEQRAGVVALAQRILQMPKPSRPRVIVGGYAVKSGLVPAILGAELMADVNLLWGEVGA